MHRPLRQAAILVLGPPAAGKTTAIRTVIGSYDDTCHFKVRDHFAHLLKEGDPVADRVAEQITSRAVLDDWVVKHGFENFVATRRSARFFLLEGYPRGAVQLLDMRDVLSAASVGFAGTIMFEASDALLHTRRGRRRTCTRCNADDQLGDDGRCRLCGGQLAPRADDAVERFERRLRHFRDTRAAMLTLLGAHGATRVLDASQSAPLLASELRRALDHLQDQRHAEVRT